MLRESPLAQGRGLKHYRILLSSSITSSPLAQGRGLKQAESEINQLFLLVAPRAGAWIETRTLKLSKIAAQLSPLAQGRGLKQHQRFP